MGVANNILKTIKKSVNRSMRQHAWNFIDIETPISNTVTMTKGGSMLTVLKYKGMNNYPGADEFQDAHAELQMLFENYFSSPGITIEIVSDIDDSRTEETVEEAVEAQRRTAKRLNFEIQDIIDSNVKELCKYTSYDETYIAIWTHLSAFNEKEAKALTNEAAEDFNEYIKEIPFNAPLFDAIRTNEYKQDLYEKHRSVVSTLVNSLERIGTQFEVMQSRDAAAALKAQIEPEVTPLNFSPYVLGDAYTPRSQDNNTKDEIVDDILTPKLDRQLARLPHFPSTENPSVYRVGSTFYYSMYVDIFPRRLRAFSVLKKAVPKGVQFRTSMLLNNGTSMAFNINNVLSTFFGFGSDKNKQIRASFEIMKEVAKDTETVKLQMHVVTRADSLQKLKRNRQALISAFAEWGNTSLALDVADPKETYISSAVGASSSSPVEAGHPTVSDVAFMSPLYRAASQWRQGSVLFTSPQGGLMPFQPASSKQESASTAIIARPRMGKSVLANAILLSLSTQGGLTRLPRVVALDIGNSSAGFIAVLKESLPLEERHLVQTVELQNTRAFAKNILDLQLGCDGPLPTERSVIQNFIEMLVTEFGKEPEDGIPQLITTAIDEAYEAFKTEELMPRYSPGRHKKLDEIVEKEGIEYQINTTPIYQIRDELFDKGLYREAEVAQLYCVPTLDDLPAIVVSSSKLQRSFGKDSPYHDLIEKFRINLTSALRRFPILSGHTQIDISGARVIALDLTAVAPKGDPKQTGIMYALATHAAANDLFLNPKDIVQYEKRYQEYQTKRIEDIAEDQKVVQFDELHRPAESKQVVNMIRQYQLEGPKYKVAVTLISQFVEHFKDLLQACTNVFILGQPDQKEMGHINDALKLSPTEIDIIQNKSHGPRPGGSALLHRMTTNDGTYFQMLRFPFGAVGLWGLGTSGDDRKIIRMLNKRLPGPTSRTIMAKYYPDGSIKKEVDSRRLDHDDPDRTVVETIYDDVIKWAKEDELI